MPDTGAPWNIPYVAASDLVSAWPTANQTMAEAIADALDDAALILQVVQGVKTDTFSTTSSSFTAITGLTASITPGSATNKVLVVAQIGTGISNTSFMGAQWRLTGGNAGNYVGDAASNRQRSLTHRKEWTDVNQSMFQETVVYLDSPATASPVTYGAEIRTNAGTVYVNRTDTDSDNTEYGRTASSITLVEVAA